jgi:hypothetical protein
VTDFSKRVEGLFQMINQVIDFAAVAFVDMEELLQNIHKERRSIEAQASRRMKLLLSIQPERLFELRKLPLMCNGCPITMGLC